MSQKQITSIGDVVEFGHYPLTRDGKVGPIEWVVLDKSKDGKKVTLLSKYGLDVQPYHNEPEDITWELCSLRAWLNDTFFNQAFSCLEKERIYTTKVAAENRIKHVRVPGKGSGSEKEATVIDDDLKFDTYAGEETEDKVYLLSGKDAIKYFDMDHHNGWYYAEDAVCEATDYALGKKSIGFFIPDNEWHGITAYRYSDRFIGKTLCWWWLRSPGSRQNDAMGIYSDGSIAYGGKEVNSISACVRPVVQVRLFD